MDSSEFRQTSINISQLDGQWTLVNFHKSTSNNDGGSGSDAVADTAKSIWEEIGLGFGKKSEHAVADTAKLEATTGGANWQGRKEMGDGGRQIVAGSLRSNQRREMAGKKGDGRWWLRDGGWELSFSAGGGGGRAMAAGKKGDGDGG
ncbi:hypothetical protein ACLOJK_022955 [Asimina triloba]